MILLDEPCGKCKGRGLHEIVPSAAEGGPPYLSCCLCGSIFESTVQEPKPDNPRRKRGRPPST